MFTIALTFTAPLLLHGEIAEVQVLVDRNGGQSDRSVALLLHRHVVDARLQAVHPEVAELVGVGRHRRTVAHPLQGHQGLLHHLVCFGVVDRRPDEGLGKADVIDARAPIQVGAEQFRSSDQFGEFLFFAEGDGPGGTGLGAAGLGPALVEEVRAERALLRDLEVLVEVDDALVGTALHAVVAAFADLGIDHHRPIRALVDGLLGTGGHARRVVAVLADGVLVGHLDLGYLSAHPVDDPVPELSGERLRFGDGRPVVAAVLVLAGDLAVVAAVALRDVYDHHLAHVTDLLPVRAPVADRRRPGTAG